MHAPLAYTRFRRDAQLDREQLRAIRDIEDALAPWLGLGAGLHVSLLMADVSESDWCKLWIAAHHAQAPPALRALVGRLCALPWHSGNGTYDPGLHAEATRQLSWVDL